MEGSYEAFYKSLAEKVNKTATEGSLEEAKEALNLFCNTAFNQESCNLLLADFEEENKVSSKLLVIEI